MLALLQFMDAVNRRLALAFLLEFAWRNPERQILLLTPQDVSGGCRRGCGSGGGGGGMLCRVGRDACVTCTRAAELTSPGHSTLTAKERTRRARTIIITLPPPPPPPPPSSAG
jgi:hypothetical protein